MKGKNDFFKEYVCFSYKFLDIVVIFKIIFVNFVYLLLFYVVFVCELCILGVYKNLERLLDLYVYILMLFDLWILIFCCWIYEYGWLWFVVVCSLVFIMKI